MERDNEMIRQLLIEFKENSKPGADISPDTEKENYHMYLLLESGLIDAKKQNYMGQSLPEYINLRITTAGHDFLEAAENNTVWEKSKQSLKEKGMNIGNVPIDVLKDYLKMQLKAHLGIE